MDGYELGAAKLIAGDFDQISRVKSTCEFFVPEQPAKLVDAVAATMGMGSGQSGVDWLVYVFEKGIWPSNEEAYLYYALRRVNNNYEPVHITPGHQFLWYEYGEMRAFLTCFALFGWGFIVCGNNAEGVMRIDHDGGVLVGDFGSSIDFSKRAAKHFTPN